MSLILRSIFLICMLGVASAVSGQSENDARSAIEGRWDITVNTGASTYPSWLEVKKSGRSNLAGSFVGRSGSARPISRIEYAGGQMRFSIPPQWEMFREDMQFEGKLEGDVLRGWTTSERGTRVEWTARRAPSLRRSGEPRWGKPISLFNGTDLKGWRWTGTNQWQAVKGVLTNVKSGANLVTEARFEDFKLHLEVRFPKGGNSGVYLRGRYEVQVQDSFGLEPANDHLGAIYGFLSPNQQAAHPPGEWQTLDITLAGRLVTVAVNGRVIICNQEIPGITGGALDSDEGAPGPIYLQGDHGPVEYRNITLTPSVSK
jgi:hypothetical protein